MRIVIDLQGAQSSGSRNRGIGRYTLSLAQAIIRNKGEHEVIIALNGLFPDTIEPIRVAFGDLLQQENIRVWHTPGPVCHLVPDNNWRRKTAELSYEAFMAELQPDVFLISSLFEGGGDDAVTSVGALSRDIPTAVILYDLIPYIYPNIYLGHAPAANWYLEKIGHLRNSELLLAISESSRCEAVEYLSFPRERTVNISTAADDQFVKGVISEEVESKIRKRYNLSGSFVMYTGGIDHRKNIDGLIRSFALIPNSIRRNHQLAIVCSIQPENRRWLEGVARQNGLAENDVILTGFVPEEDLIALYHLCKAFIFPSWHEGFGLPALEAMACGAPVIAANTSSLPEVIGREDALFDPRDDKAIAEKLAQVLSDSAYRAELIKHGMEQAKKFSWDVSAKRTIAAFEQVHVKRQNSQKPTFSSGRRLRLAYISPLPPEHSGIADYSAELLPELARHYDIDVVINQDSVSTSWIKANCAVRDIHWFKRNAHLFDRVLYQIGNSHYHKHMFDLVKTYPGCVVLHDFFLGDILSHLELHGTSQNLWTEALYEGHGYRALKARFTARTVADTAHRYPCNLAIVRQALGVITHSYHSCQLAQQWYGDTTSQDWSVIPLLRVNATPMTRADARKALGLDENAFFVCSFGLLGPTKQNARLLDAWLASPLGKDKHCHLLFVGENHGGEYGNALTATIQNSGISDRISITGWIDLAEFRKYLAAADVGVQLRTLSRGETSAAVLDCMNYGLPTIVNANGSMADLPEDAVWMLPDEFGNDELINALAVLWKDEKKRHAIGQGAREMIAVHHGPRSCADQYAEAIEHHYERAQSGKEGLVKSIAMVEGAPADEDAWLKLAQDIASNHNPSAIRQLMVDVSELMQRDANDVARLKVRSVLAELLANPPKGFRIEPVYATSNEPGYRYARQFTLHFLSCPPQALTDDPVTAFNGDVFLGIDLEPYVVPQRAAFCQHLRRIGAQVHFVVYDFLPDVSADAAHMRGAWQATLEQADGVVCMSRVVADGVSEWLTVFGPNRLRPLKLGWFREGTDTESLMPAKEDSAAGSVPQSDTMPWLTWRESTQNLLDVMLGGQWYRQWMPDEVQRFWGSDNRLGTQVGKRSGRDMECTGQAGHLIYGPYIPLAAGRYQVVVRGALGENGAAGARMDVAVDQGSLILGESMLNESGSDGCIVTLPIALDTPCTDLEIRVWVSEGSELRISMIEIAPWRDESTDPQPSAQAMPVTPAANETAWEAVDVELEASSVELTGSSEEVQPEDTPISSAVQSVLPVSSNGRNQAKAKRKKRR
jgi:glycosyltransferase involved in cell wall biosynthesis